MKTDQLKKHIQLFTEGTPVPDDDLPGANPPPASAGTDMASRLRAAKPYTGDEEKYQGRKMVELTEEEKKKLKDIFDKMDAILIKYLDINKKPFESVDFESMTESEQRQCIMQNLHLLSEADQMVVLRGLVNEESLGKAAAAAAARAIYNDFVKPGIQGAGGMVKSGIENTGALVRDLTKSGVEGAGGLGKEFARGAGRLLGYAAAGTVLVGLGASGAIYAWNNWDQMFPPNPAIDRLFEPEDKAEFTRLAQEAQNGVLAPLDTTQYFYVYPQDLTEQIDSLQARWKKITAASEERRRAQKAGPAKPGIVDKASDVASDALDKIKGMLSK